ncbi:MAG TPA: phosphotransferase [Actinocrinis sp.]|jgi:spectinomycin phosphotransferase
MHEKPDISDAALLRHLRDGYDVGACAVEFLALGADADSFSYRASCAERTLFVKLRREVGEAAAARVALVAQLAADERTYMLAPLPARDGRPFMTINSFTAMLYPFVAGRNGFEARMSEEHCVRLGTALRVIHNAELPPDLLSHIRVEAYSPRWRDEMRAYLAPRAYDRPPDDYARELAEIMRHRHQQLAEILARADQLASLMHAQAAARPHVFCHSDIHGGNIMLADDGAVYIVDWDDPVLAPKERDLMYIGGGVGTAWNTPEESSAFYRGYGPAEVDPLAIAYYRYVRITEDVALACEHLFTADAADSPQARQDRALTLRFFKAQFEPGDVVAAADQAYAALSAR